jgi:hypothetical protein
MGGACSTHGRNDEILNAYKTLVGKYEGNIPFGRPRHRWNDSIRIVMQM